MSLIFSCIFARVAVKESLHKSGRAQQETDPVQRWKNYCNMFDETARSIFTVEKTMYRKKSQIIYNLFRKMSSQRRNDYLKHFFPFRTGRLYRHHKNVSIRCLTVVLVKCIILIFSPCFQLLQQANASHRR